MSTNNDMPRKYYLCKGIGERVTINGMYDFRNNILAVKDTMEEAEAEAWRLADESIHGGIHLWSATGETDGVFEDGDFHAFYPIPSERTTTKFVIRRVVGNKGKNLCMCDTLAEAEAKALAIKAKNEKNVFKRFFGDQGILVIIGYYYKKDGTCVGGGGQYRLYKESFNDD